MLMAIRQWSIKNYMREYEDTIYAAESFDLIQAMPEKCFDLIIADGPYAKTEHDWDKVEDIQEFNLQLISECSRIMKPGASLYLFGKHNALDFVDYRSHLKLNTRIIWYQPSRLAQGRLNYTDNFDVIYYFSKGRASTYNLDDIRVPQMVELAHRKRCENVPSVKNGKFGKTQFNPKGKNPGNVWGDIKQLTYRSKELVNRKMLNTIQKPEKLMERIVKASSKPGDFVFDAFAGTGTAVKVAAKLGRKVCASEYNPELAMISYNRLRDVCDNARIDFSYSADSTLKSMSPA